MAMLNNQRVHQTGSRFHQMISPAACSQVTVVVGQSPQGSSGIHTAPPHRGSCHNQPVADVKDVRCSMVNDGVSACFVLHLDTFRNQT